MKIKSLAAALLTTIAASAFAVPAPASIFSDSFSGNAFSNLLVGTINIGSVSNLNGSFFAAENISGTTPFSYNLSLDKVTFSGGAIGDWTTTGDNFSFHNVAAGNYVVKATGTLSGTGQVHNLALIGASYTITPVPEPETYGMLLVGLGLMGAVVRRRNKSDSDQA